ncbi:hypothetical protein [Rubritalea halochordaticola]
MNTDTQSFIDALPSVPPNEAALYELIDRYQELEVGEVVMPILSYMERHACEDLGSPGPLVHLIEKSYPNYVEMLKVSISRKPTALTVWMLNRILNAKLENDMRVALLNLMKVAATHPKADNIAQQEAAEFLKHQNQSI